MSNPLQQGTRHQVSYEPETSPLGAVNTPLFQSLDAALLQPASELNSTAMAGSSSTFQVSTKTSQCSDCGRVFKRPCELNRHYKTHIRPCKCTVPDCEYNTRGFPTKQELERHMDDRHNNKPPQFKCDYPGCTYTAKRESNCKQHKEKKHQWTYDRTRHNHKPKGSPNGQTKSTNISTAMSVSSAMGTSTMPMTPATPVTKLEPMSTPVFGDAGHLSALPLSVAPSVVAEDVANSFNSSDFILYPETQSVLCDGNNNNHNNHNNTSDNYGALSTTGISLTGLSNPSPNSFVPWDSPPSHAEELNRLIDDASKSILPCQNGQVPLAIEPPMTYPDYPKSIAYALPPDMSLLQASPDTPILHDDVKCFALQTPDTSPLTPQPWYPFAATNNPMQSTPGAAGATCATDATGALAAMAFSDAVGDKLGTSSVQIASSIQQQIPSSVQQQQQQQQYQLPVIDGSAKGVKRDRDEDSNGSNDNGDGDDDDDDNDPPSKRQNLGPQQSFCCVFHMTDPAYYSGDQYERYRACETPHQHISQMLRHLSRAAHKYELDRGWLSSFNAESPGKQERKAALCRHCYAAFFDEASFEEHKNRGCAKRNLSPPEIYQLLSQTFCSKVLPQDWRARIGQPQLKVPSPSTDFPVLSTDPSAATRDHGNHFVTRQELNEEMRHLRQDLVQQMISVLQQHNGAMPVAERSSNPDYQALVRNMDRATDIDMDALLEPEMEQANNESSSSSSGNNNDHNNNNNNSGNSNDHTDVNANANANANSGSVSGTGFASNQVLSEVQLRQQRTLSGLSSHSSKSSVMHGLQIRCVSGAAGASKEQQNQQENGTVVETIKDSGYESKGKTPAESSGSQHGLATPATMDTSLSPSFPALPMFNGGFTNPGNIAPAQMHNFFTNENVDFNDGEPAMSMFPIVEDEIYDYVDEN